MFANRTPAAVPLPEPWIVASGIVGIVLASIVWASISLLIFNAPRPGRWFS